MGGDGYYPEYYLRKRKRDRVYSNISRTALFIVVAAVGIACGFLLFHYVGHRAPVPAAGLKEMADKRQEIGNEQKLAATAQDRPPQAPTADYSPVALDKLQYSDTSLPVTSVSLQRPGQAATTAPTAAAAPEKTGNAPKPGAGGDAAGGTSGTLQTPPPTPAQGMAVPPTAKPPVAKPLPADPNAAKAASAAAKTAEKKPDPKPEKKPADAVKTPKTDATQPKPEPAKPAAKDVKAVTPPTKTMYHVYGGRATSKDQADKLKRDLSSQGYAGSIIKSGGDFLVLVATLDDVNKADALTEELHKRGFDPFSTRLKSSPAAK